MNHVNLIGKLSNTPRIVEMANGRKLAQFTLTTQETVLKEDGSPEKKLQWHRIIAWGKWVQVMESLGQKGMDLAIEGKLITRFYTFNGSKQTATEVEVNDLIIL